MKYLLIAAFAVSMATATSTGCVLVGQDRQKSSRADDCHPSEYWDGNQCVHKGKGKGKGKGKSKGKGKGKGR